ncbi:MAG: rhodanese-like domain-containing protein [Zoogloeaceae bacterium]|nr:rhodanese-like domain-containing protein [Zoogloeaceae bacterium]
MDFLQQNWHWAALAAFTSAVLVFDLLKNRQGGTSLSAMEATLKINRDDALVLDVRTPDEFSRGHIAGARNVPMGDLERRLTEFDKQKAKPVILCCQSGARSQNAADTLRKAGFEQVFNLHGGLQEWERAGQPVSRKRK